MLSKDSFAIFPAFGAHWDRTTHHSLLSALQKRIKDGTWIDRPRIVELGANDNFILITEKHATIWNLENYKILSSLLDVSAKQERGIFEIHSVTLHTYRFGGFVMQLQNGIVRYDSLPPHSLPGMQLICASILQDTQLRREWSEHKQHFTAQSKGVKLSLSLSVSIGGIARLLR
jgi:hypothetical protein